jgi:indolepyruvate ferredoxin oxidoreductase beta subunit
VIKAGETAQKVGNAKTMNIVLLGALVKAMKLDKIDWPEMIRKNVQESLAAINIKAFEAGLACV